MSDVKNAAAEPVKCICDGGLYEGFRKYPFIANVQCAVHGVLSPKEQAVVDDKNAALIAKARAILDTMRWAVAPERDGTTIPVPVEDLRIVIAALEAAVQSPAVDREAFDEALRGWSVSGSVFDHLLAFGVLQDAREVEARGYDQGWNKAVEGLCGPSPDRTQQVREGKSA